MRRTVRVLGITGALASTLALAACDKPVPEITVQSGATAMTVTPTNYSFDASHSRTSQLNLNEITARSGGTVLIDVPRQVVGRGWAVNAISLDAKHTVVGGSGAIRDSHSYRVAAQSNNGNPFIVQVLQLRDGKPDGSVWSFLVKVSDSA